MTSSHSAKGGTGSSNPVPSSAESEANPYPNARKTALVQITVSDRLRWRADLADLLFQKESALALWYRARTADSRLGTRKTMIVALARKLLIALWRFVTTGETLERVILRPAG
jgi:hypothetical protein